MRFFRSARAASKSLCVTIKKVLVELIAESKKQLVQFFGVARVEVTTWLIGKISAGAFIKALATATRCCSSPDSCAGRFWRWSCRPSLCKRVSTFCFKPFSCTPIKAVRHAFSSAVNSEGKYMKLKNKASFLISERCQLVVFECKNIGIVNQDLPAVGVNSFEYL